MLKQIMLVFLYLDYKNVLEEVAERPYDEVPIWFKNWENTGLIRFDDKNHDGIIQYVGNKEDNELTIDRDIMVLANPEIARPVIRALPAPCAGWESSIR